MMDKPCDHCKESLNSECDWQNMALLSKYGRKNLILIKFILEN